jgi:hypothetical protein
MSTRRMPSVSVFAGTIALSLCAWDPAAILGEERWRHGGALDERERPARVRACTCPEEESPEEESP